jgi:aldehyde:ferredoxin oxidoreductase
MRVATIGPASERLSLISGIINDRGRAAARSGVGAVMGSKRLKAVAVRGEGKVLVADKDRLDRLRKDFVRELRDRPGFSMSLMNHGTCGGTGSLLECGSTPVKNWQMAGGKAFPGHENITDTDGIELKWGDGEAILAMLDKIIRREGLGDILADGVRIASKKIGGNAEACAVHVGGQEPGMHSPLFLPGRGTGYLCDPTPGRHTATPMPTSRIVFQRAKMIQKKKNSL